MANIADIRKQYPDLAGLDDDSVVNVLHETYYSDLSRDDVANALGVKPAPAPVKPSSTARKLLDYPLAFAGGAVNATKALADAAGAGNVVSNGLNAASQGISDYLSPEAKAEDQQIAEIMADAKAKGMNIDGVMSGIKAFGVAPVRQMLGGLGSVAPVLAGAALAPAGVPATLAAGGIGAAMGAGTAKGAIFDDVKKRHMDAGASEADAIAAATKAQEYGGENTDQIALGTALGTADSLTGVTKAVTGLAKGGITNAAKGGVLRRALTGAAGEMPLEMAQGGQERLAANIAAQREGFDVGTWDNVASNATLEGLASAGPGAAFGAMRPREKTAGDFIRDTKVPEVGALSKAANTGIEIAAQEADKQPIFNPASDDANPPINPPPASAPVAELAIENVAEPEAKPNVEPQQTGPFTTPKEAQDYISNQRRAASVNLPAALPVEYPDHTFGVATAGSPDYQEAERQKKSRTLIDAGVLEGDLLSSTGDIIKTKAAATNIAKKNGGGDVVPVTGGFVIRKQEATNENTDKAAAGAIDTAGNVAAGDSGTAADSGAVLSKRSEADLPTGTENLQDTTKTGDLAGKKIDKEWTAFAQDSGTLNVPRAEMPQIKAEHRGAMVNFFKGKGIESVSEEVQSDTLKPTQTEFSQSKVQKAKDYQGGNRSILISSDNHVLDGHHQWLAKRDLEEPIQAIRIDAPIKTLLETVKEFPSVSQSDATNNIATQASNTPAATNDVKKPPGLAKVRESKAKRDAELDQLFGVPQKRERAIARIAKGTAYFGNMVKAGDFIKENGLKDTHEVVKTKPGRFDIVAKSAKQEAKPTRQDAVQKATDAAKESLSKGGTDDDANRAATDALIDQMADTPDISISVDAPAAVKAAKAGKPDPQNIIKAAKDSGRLIIAHVGSKPAAPQDSVQDMMKKAVSVDHLSNDDIDKVAGIFGIKTPAKPAVAGAPVANVAIKSVAEESQKPDSPSANDLKSVGDITITIQTDSGPAKLTVNAEKALASIDARYKALEMVKKCLA